MIIPSSTHGVIASSRKKIVVASSSVTPTPALDWTPTLYCDEASLCQDYTQVQVQGISQTITLALGLISTSGAAPPAIYCRKDSTPTSSYVGYCDTSLNFAGSYSSPIPQGRVQGLPTTVYNGDTQELLSLTAASGDYISFVSYGNAPFGTHTATIQITNQSDGNAIIDTIIFRQG